MKILINGVGRSGTSFLTETIREIVYQEKKIEPYCIYEPFLWGEAVWNIDYMKENHLYEKMSSISYEGVFNHLTLPLYINDPEKFTDNTYLRKILNMSEINIIKFVRGLGRIKLLHAMEPTAKHIFIIRNPIDNMNSVISHGSLLGEEWHRNDDKRMYRELKEMNYKTNKNDESSLFEKELVWWYSMNEFYLKETSKLDIDILYLTYENLIKDFESSIKKICNHLEINFSQNFLNLLNKQRGSRSSNNFLNRENLDSCSNYMNKYENLIKTYNIECDVNLNEVHKKYNKLNKKEYDRSNIGLTPTFTKKKMKEKQFISRIKYLIRTFKNIIR